MAHSRTKAQVRLDPEVEAAVLDEMKRISEEEATNLNTTQATNRMLREWKKMRASAKAVRK